MTIQYTALALVVDRSGSMHSLVNDVKGSVTQFICDQKNAPGKAAMTLVQFDNQYDVVYNFSPIQAVDADKFTKEYQPRGSTALLDAIGKTTLAMESTLKTMKEGERPQRVVVAILTDGEENASTEFTLEKIQKLITEKEADKTVKWDFVFLGATLDAIKVAKSMGFCASKAASYDTSNIKQAFASFSEMAIKARLNHNISYSDKTREVLRNPAQSAT